MLMVPVTSSNLASIGYDESSRTLHIRFKSGSLYAYFGVSVDVYRSLMSANSHGRYFNARIKGRYGDRRIG